MGRARLRKTVLMVIAGGCLALALPIPGSAGPLAAQLGGVEMTSDGRVSPRGLPRQRSAPATLHLSSQIAAAGAQPPALRELVFDLDRDVQLNLRHYPGCHFLLNVETPVEEFLSRCRGSIVGKGTVGIDLALEESPTVHILGSLTLYKWRGDNYPLLARMYLRQPIPGLIVIPISVERLEGGPYGTEAVLTIPKIANGQASITSFSLHVGKGLGYRHTRRSLVTSRCSDGQLEYAARAVFADGQESSSESVQPCAGRFDR